jgi:DNA-3-methyladenine glycosylase I
MVRYHDEEWGVPEHDDVRLFEFLILEGAQAGLSWRTILERREGYRAAFDGFDMAAVAAFDDARMAALAENTAIIRNKAKIRSAVNNARAALAVREEFGSLDAYLWGFVDGRPIQNAWRTMEEVPAQTDISVAMSKDMKRRGFSFVGPTVMYAFMQSMGMVNDHLVDCWRYEAVRALGEGA